MPAYEGCTRSVIIFDLMLTISVVRGSHGIAGGAQHQQDHAAPGMRHQNQPPQAGHRPSGRACG
ncbi:MAG: hypothetical protein JO264_13825 [Acidisphaera sp.]|nr:hypothetical protein [Acidisphaera sp.]